MTAGDAGGDGELRGGGYDAVVLAGGAAGRLGGADKPALRVGGRSLLDRVLGACAGAGTTVVVGDPRPTARPVTWTREVPPGGGPLAALDAGLRLLRPVPEGPGPSGGTDAVRGARTGSGPGRAGPSAPEGPADRTVPAGPLDAGAALPPPTGPDGVPAHVVVLSADLPFLGTDTVHRLLHALGRDGAGSRPDVDGVVLTDPGGRDQPLVAVYRTGPLRRALSGIADAHGGVLVNLPLRRLTDRLELARVSDPVAPSASFDCDTWEDLAAARARIREHGYVLDEWITAVKAELGIELDVDTALLLDLARDAAHGVARPAAPLTTFLVGYAAALSREAGPEAVAEATRKAVALAARWAEEDTPKDGTGSAERPDAG